MGGKVVGALVGAAVGEIVGESDGRTVGAPWGKPLGPLYSHELLENTLQHPYDNLSSHKQQIYYNHLHLQTTNFLNTFRI